MGIKNLMKVLNDHTPDSVQKIKLNQLRGKKIAIDTSIILYQYVIAIRSTGDDLKSPTNKSTSHIMGILIKTLNYLKMGIIPIHVFDGKPPNLKMKILNDRSKIKKEAISKLLEIEEKSNNQDQTIILDQETLDLLEAEKIKLLKQSVSISRIEMMEAYDIIKLLGVPAILAPEEADSQCAYLSINDMVDYIASEDMDLLTFGSKIILKNFMKDNMYEVKLDKILELGNITMDQFIDICILLGCDYTDTIDGIGPKKAWELIVKYGSLENLISSEPKIAQNKFKLPDNFRFEESREYFKNPRHIDINPTDLNLSKPRLNELKQLLVLKYGFNSDVVEKMIGFLRKKYNIYDHNTKKTNDDPFVDDTKTKSNTVYCV